jgi:hemin uptake protein HemP
MATATVPNAGPGRPHDGPHAAAPGVSAGEPQRRRLHTDALFAGAHEIEIQHGEAVYRLRITSLGKLILTK